jgi:large subunit ribosomal protein L20
MTRIKRGVMHVKSRRSLLKKTKGFKWGRKNLVKAATTAVHKAGAHALRGRREKKRTNRRLWQVKLNAAVRQFDLNYSGFINLLKKNKIELDRKVLAEIAEKQPKIFEKIIAQIKK